MAGEIVWWQVSRLDVFRRDKQSTWRFASATGLRLAVWKFGTRVAARNGTEVLCPQRLGSRDPKVICLKLIIKLPPNNLTSGRGGSGVLLPRSAGDQTVLILVDVGHASRGAIWDADDDPK